MKVKDLIALLEQQPQEIKIDFYDLETEGFKDVCSVEQEVSNTGKINKIFLNIGFNS